MATLFDAPKWLGFKHDGYPVASNLKDYLSIRASDKDSPRPPAVTYQSLLTFGVLEAVTNTRVIEADMIIQDADNVPIMTRASLTSILRRCFEHVATSDEDEKRTYLANINLVIDQMMRLLHIMIDQRIFDHPIARHWQSSILTVIATIGESISVTRNGLYSACAHVRDLPPPNSPGPNSWNFILHLHRDQLDGMASKNGWCPSAVGYLMDSTTLKSIIFAVQKRAFDLKNHARCEVERCEASIIDPDQYEAKHAVPHCDCEWIQPPLENVTTLIAAKSVPVMRLQGLDPGQRPSLFVASFHDHAYVAVSHVWSDGLGSITEKGLPLCQVRRLSSLAADLVPGGHFWIDSLCVPSEKGARRDAIGLMASTYSDAQKILVLDESIQRLPSSVAAEDRLLCVLSSGWMRRLWTLQEGALSRELLFRFQDASLPAPALIPPTGRLALSPVLSGLSSGIFRILKKKQHDNRFGIGDVARALRWRSTSRPSDEALAVASLLDLDPLALLAEAHSERRVARLLAAVGAVPRNILFASGAKMAEPGLRWAPRTFMTARGGLSLTTSESDARVSPRGLVAEYAAYVFDACTLGARRFWYIALPQEDTMLRITDAFEQEGTFRCNVLLFPHHLAPGEPLATVGAVSTPENLVEATDSEHVLHCAYQRRLIARRIPLEDGVHVLSAKWKGNVTVCIG